MAKNLSTFQPGSITATSDLKYKTIVYTGPYGPDMNGCAGGTDYGHQHYHMDRKRHTFCGGSMKKGKLEDGGTDIYMFGGGGPSGGTCCCQQSSSGRSGGVAKYSPQWVGDSDHLFICVSSGCGCCTPECNGKCSGHTNVQHRSGGAGGTIVNCIKTESGCGAAGVCNYNYNPCCNYGALGSGGAALHPCCRGCTEATCHSSCLENPTPAEDYGYDCVYCKASSNYGFESGSCINRCDSGICGKPMWSSFGNWKQSGYRSGSVMIRMTDFCEQGMGGFSHRNTYCCDYGGRSEYSGYMMQGMSLPSAQTCGGACCCGAPGSSPLQIIRFHEDEA